MSGVSAMLAVLHVGRIGLGRRGNAHLRIDRLSNVNRSAPMPNLENLRKQAKLVLLWHRDRYYPVAAQIRSGLPCYSQMSDTEILALRFKLSDAQELVARQHGFESWTRTVIGCCSRDRRSKLRAMHVSRTRSKCFSLPASTSST